MVKASRGLAIGLFACVYGVAKWSNSKELRYFAMIFSVMLLAVTILLKWWSKRQHRISSDPLSIPGPRSTDPTSGNLSQLAKCGSLNDYIKGLTRIYGPIGAFYWGTKRVVYISSQTVLSHTANKPLLQNLDCKPLFLYQGLKPLIGIHNIEFANGAIYHAKMNKIFNKIYGKEKIYKLIHNQYKIMNDVNNEWMDKLNTDKASDIDIETDLFSFATKALTQTIFNNNNNNNNMELITDIMHNYNTCYTEMEQRLVNGLPPDNERKLIFDKAIKQLKFNIHKILDMTAANLNTNDTSNNLISYFKQNNELYPNQESISDEIITLLHGIYKIYYGLLWMCYFIAKHKHIQNKIMDEIGCVFGTNDKHEKDEKEIFNDNNKCKEYMDKLMELKYCRNVIMETLRITSIKSWTARVCTEDIILNTMKSANKKVKIPANMPIILGLGAINTEKKQWGNPYTFKPDRYETKNKNENNVDENWNVFCGLGHRMCPGQNVFEMQALLFMVHVLSKFTWSLKTVENESNNAIRPKYGLLTKPNKTIDFVVSKRQFAML